MLKGSDINGINKHHYTFILIQVKFQREEEEKEGRISREDEVFW
jgi:hypothetical protein